MSSIDKGVEQVVRGMGRNVRIVKIGCIINGYIGTERVFSLLDRYGYLNDREEKIIRDGIRDYDEETRRRAERAEAERRAREEAIRLAREEEERRRKERLEAERQAELKAVRDAVAEKKREAKEALDRAIRAEETSRVSMRRRKEALDKLSKGAPTLDFSALTEKNEEDELRQKRETEAAVARCRSELAEVEKFERTVTGDKTTEEYKSMRKACKALSVSSASINSFEYENVSFTEKVTEMERGVEALKPALSELEKSKSADGEVGIIAREALKSASMHSLEDVGDVSSLANMVENRIQKISASIESAKTSEEAGKLAGYQGAAAACKKTQTLMAEGTYEAKDYRAEIEARARKTLAGFKELFDEEFTTCSAIRGRQIKARLEDILIGSEKGEDTLREVEKFESELVEYKSADERHRGEYEEYLSMVEELREYGVDESEIEKFDVATYAEQRKRFSARISEERREAERALIFTTDVAVKSVMEEMGFEQFASIGDSEGYIRESLFTKAGYDGVLWQVITYSDGSVSRRIIGVNKGETQTDKEYVKEVAREMEAKGDPQEFLKRFQEATGSTLAVTEAVESDSEDVDEAIERNGYHYLTGEALELYEEKTQIVVENKPVKSKDKQVRVTGKDLVRSSTDSVKEARRKSKAMSKHAD
jgi:hypothetical protein